MVFLANLQQERLNYYRTAFLILDKVYAGYGMEPGEPYNKWAKGWLVRGWTMDFLYYTQNNHPFFVMVFTNPFSPYTSMERKAEFFGALLTSFGGAGFLIATDAPPTIKSILAVLFITIPMQLFRLLTYYLFATPCLNNDATQNSSSVNCCISCCDRMAASFGWLICQGWSLVFLVLGIILWITHSSTSGFIDWGLGIGYLYVVWFYNIIFFKFNPSPTFSKIMCPWNWMISCVSCGFLSSSYTVGLWHKERAKIQGIFHEKIKERGPTKFFLPPVITAIEP